MPATTSYSNGSIDGACPGSSISHRASYAELDALLCFKSIPEGRLSAGSIRSIVGSKVQHLFALLLPLSLAGLASSEHRVIAVSVDNVIHPITVEILAHGIEQAERERADLLLIRLNT